MLNLASMSRLRLSARIYLGFGTLLVLLSVVATMAVVAIRNDEAVLDYYSDVSDNTRQVTSIDGDFLAIRRQVLIYASSGDAKAVTKIRELSKDLDKQAKAALAGTTNAERKAKLQKVVAGIGDYLRNFEKAAELRVAQDKTVAESMNVLGPQARTRLSEIVKSAMTDGDHEAAAHAGMAQEQLLLARLNAVRFLDKPEQGIVERVKQEFADFKHDMDELNKHLQNPGRRKLAAEAVDLGNRYFEAFSNVVTATFDLNKLISVTMADQAEQIAALADEVTEAQRAYLAQIESDAQKSARFNEWLLIVLGGIALTLGAASAWLIARGIVKPVRGLTAGMKQLAAGDFSVVLPGLGRKDEIGEIANAVEEFKVKAEEKARLEADETLRRQKAEAEAQAKAAEERAKVAEEQAGVVEALALGLKRLSNGDLTHRLQDCPGTYRQISDDFNTAVSRLDETVASIASAAREVSSAAAEISTGTVDLSQRTEEQAAGLEQTSASMEQLSATVKKNAENAQDVTSLSGDMQDIGSRGADVVSKAVDAMSRIEESSRKISDIIVVIDEIARQTNLLALNAAVEAARAGEAGRGFAVVASEVRSLAQRSSQAAKDIKILITNSSTQVQEGVELVNHAGSSLQEIAQSIKKVADSVSAIASASAEQAVGIEQVNKAIAQMDEVTQQNSALVEQNAASAKMLEQQAIIMDERMRFFQLREARSGGEPAGAVPIATHRSAPTAAAATAAPVRSAAKRSNGPVQRMQGARAATAAAQKLDWKEF